MDRYQFKGYISDYIENSLSISKRKEFDQYLKQYPEAKTQVEAVRSTIFNLRNLPQVKTSDVFMEKLQSRVATQRDVLPTQQEKRKPLIFGFTPLTATMMSLVVLAIVFVGYELMPVGTSNPVAIPPQVTTNSMLSAPAPVNNAPITQINASSVIAEAEEDSALKEVDLQKINPALEDRINYVKTQ